MANLPDYVASAKPLPKDKRIGWLTSTAATYAGIMLWFVFWQGVPTAESMSQGIGVAMIALAVAAIVSYAGFYLVPGLLGMKTGLPLYIVGTSTYGAVGGFIMPGFLMGCLQFGWLAVNSFFSSMVLVDIFGYAPMSLPHLAVGIIWAIVAAFVGLKGIQYVGAVATYLPIIPFVILIILVVLTIGGIGNFNADMLASAPADAEAAPAETPEAAPTDAPTDTEAAPAEGEAAAPEIVPADGEEAAVAETEDGIAGEAMVAQSEAINTGEAMEEAAPAAPSTTMLMVFLGIMTYVVGFFATAGAAGCDFGMNNKDEKAIQGGGLVGVALAIFFTGACAILIVAGALGAEKVAPGMVNIPSRDFLSPLVGNTGASVFLFLLAVAAFPPACFSSFIAANSFKTTLPKVDPFISCGVGTLLSILLVVTGAAGDAGKVFTVIGASFGPVCGAMLADYLLAGCKWPGPRAGFNPAGWISWIVGFVVGGYDLLAGITGWYPALGIPCPPVAAFIVGFVLYLILAKAGLESKVQQYVTEAPETSAE